MVYSSLAFCTCGCEIWIEYLWNGVEWSLRFTDGNLEEVYRCPDCGIELRSDDLE